MARPDCTAVFPRDRLTHEKLLSQGIKSYPVGNPMMDGLSLGNYSPKPLQTGEKIILTLLPGSRSPEVERNWILITQSLAGVMSAFPEHPITFLGAIAPSLSLEPFITQIQSQGWQKIDTKEPSYFADALSFRKNNAHLIFTQWGFADCLSISQGAIAMAGTATEQFVGMGKPVVSFPGDGPQYNDYFARRQTLLLGESLVLVDKPEQVGDVLKNLLNDGHRLLAIARNGRERLGETGAARRIATILQEKWG
jgi:uncharacterized protein (TIGR03492 family)